VAAAREFLGRPNDDRFEPGDAALDCSELVQRAMEVAIGAVVGRCEGLCEFDGRPCEAELPFRVGRSIQRAVAGARNIPGR
jgi:hypothetical protein